MAVMRERQYHWPYPWSRIERNCECRHFVDLCTHDWLVNGQLECPKCKGPCYRDSVHNGIGFQFGPWGCTVCGWSEWDEYDLSTGKDPVDEKGGAIDQYGSYHPPGSSLARAYRLARTHGAI